VSLEQILIAAAWVVTTVTLIIFIPRDKIREAIVILLFKQLLTWMLGLTVVELGLIEYPVRLFAHANNTSFTFEYYVYPAVCVIFNLHFPVKKSRFYKVLQYVVYCSGITLIEFFIERYTEIINYIHWEWYITWITLMITFFISRQFYLWFFKLKQKGSR
jgi:hypothetical protein